MSIEWIILAFFFPLFPASALFINVINRIQLVWLKLVLLLLWPQAGMVVYAFSGAATIPQWLLIWAVCTALLYAYRALTIHALNGWINYMAISSWSLLWLAAAFTASTELAVYALAFSLPLILLTTVNAHLKAALRKVYMSIHDGIASPLPGISLLLVCSVMTAMAAPLSPGFFIIIDAARYLIANLPLISVLLILTWFFWSWSGMRLTAAVISGPASDAQPQDISTPLLALYMLALAATAVLGSVYFGGKL